MAKFYDENGNEVEGFNQEELDAKIKESIEEFKKEDSGKVEKLEEELKKAQEDLESYKKENSKGKDGDKDGKEDDEKDEIIKGLTEKVDKLMERIDGDVKSKALDRLAGDDSELREKLENEYNNFGGEPANETEIIERMTKAATIVNGSAPKPNFMDGASDASLRGDGNKGGGSDKEESENSKTMRKAMGITDEDIEKYGDKEGGDK